MVGRERLRELKRLLRDERAARKELERDAEASSVVVDAGLPHGWFETRDAAGETVWVHRVTQHTSKLVPLPFPGGEGQMKGD